MFTIPTSTVTDLMASVSDVFTSVWLLVVLAIAIPLAFVLIHYIKGLFPKAKGK
jgi:type II secretory pathway component PulF